MKKLQVRGTRYRDANLFAWHAKNGYCASAEDLLFGLDGTPIPAQLFATVDGIPVGGGALSHREGLRLRHAVYVEAHLPRVVVYDAVAFDDAGDVLVA